MCDNCKDTGLTVHESPCNDCKAGAKEKVKRLFDEKKRIKRLMDENRDAIERVRRQWHV